jgi:glycogen(starch) synthase
MKQKLVRVDLAHKTAPLPTEPMAPVVAEPVPPLPVPAITEPLQPSQDSLIDKEAPPPIPAGQVAAVSSAASAASTLKPITKNADWSSLETETPDATESTLPPDDLAQAQLPILFEIAWEVCWQLGGIYTVLRSKASTMQQRWRDRYFLVGPYNPNTAAMEFEELPPEGYIQQIVERMRSLGVPCYYGRWLVPGRPRVILLDYRARFHSLDTDKYLAWADHGISTPSSDGEVNEVIAFGFTVAQFFAELTKIVADRKILAHFHEWMAGVAVPRIAHLKIPVVTIFTTHATLLGRYLASDSPHFYQHLPFINADTEAARYNILPRHLIEKAAAHSATVFTTVSEVTAAEAQQLLGRLADVILPNGLNIQRFSALHEFQNLHREYKERIHEFVMGHFFPSYTFDLDRTLYVFTSGRYEYRNKGMDLFIEALAKLNQRLKTITDPPTVVSFIITRAATRSINVGVLQNQLMFDELRKTCMELKERVGRRIFNAAVHGRLPGPQDFLTEDSRAWLRRAMHAWRTSRQPPIVTHDLMDDNHDPVLQHLRSRALFNAKDDPVKIVFHPEFVTATSPLISLDYEQFVRGCNMGVFPSYYEPWGYTPMECAALGLPAVTTDLSGFGAYVQRHIPEQEHVGITVVNRRSRSFDQAVDETANSLFDFVQMNRRQRVELRNQVERLSDRFDWSHLIRHYDEAYDLAMKRVGIERIGSIEVKLV